jgi:hypothetical protein
MKSKVDALIIAYWFPPASNQTWRSYHFFRALQNQFQNIKIISTSNRKYLPEKDYKDTNKFITTASTIDYRLFTYFIKKEIKHVDERFKPKWAFKIYNILNSFPFNLLAGEGGLIYIITGFLKGLKLLNKNDKSLIFSTFRPYSDHAIAFLLKLFRPNCFWIADFRDLHLDPRLNETIFPILQAWVTRKILSKADVVTTVSQGLAIHLHPFHHQVAVLRNGIGNHSSLVTVDPKHIPNDKFTIAYTGSMFRELRKPELLLEAITELIEEQRIISSKLQIIYAGKDTATWQRYLKKYDILSNFNSLGTISHEATIRLQSIAHINLLLTYASPELKGNATGKLYEYLAARRPIILLVNGCKDEELEEIFEETGAGLVAYDSLNHKELVKEFVLKKYIEWLETGEVSPSISPEKLETFKWDYMMKHFLDRYYFKTLQVGA